MLETLNGLLCLVLAAAMSWAVLHPQVHDGIVIKAGLIVMVLGLFGLACQVLPGIAYGGGIYIARTVLLINIGAVIVIAGYAWRRARAGEPRRRRSDFVTTGRKP